MCACGCISVCMWDVGVLACAFVCVYVYLRVHVCLYVCVFVSLGVLLCLCVGVCVLVWVYLRVHVCVCERYSHVFSLIDVMVACFCYFF